MRLLILVLLMTMAGCGGVANSNSATEKSIIGKWKIVTFSTKPVEIEKIKETKVNYYTNIKPDNTFESTSEGNVTNGTYTFNDGIITFSIEGQTIRSSLRFEKDFMIMTTLDKPSALITYLKRAD